jgi:ABC-type transport system involved in cytochrome c biogenesis permease subunit
MKIDGYSFCIKGVDNGNLSLLVAHDIYGLPISYTGYMMVFVSFLMLFFDRKSNFHKTLQQLQGGRRTKEKNENPHYKELAGRMGIILTIPTILFVCLWYKRGIFPATNGAESLFLFALTTAIIAVAFKFKKRFAALRKALIIVAGIVTVIAWFGFERDAHVQPILRTPLLGIHVTTIIIAYALLACTAINAVIALCGKENKRASKALIGRALLYPATMLLATGIFIGAVWANISWGRYWGWDPKEVWALVTLLVCSMGFHSHSLRFISKPVPFHIFCIVAFLAVLFTFFGVNWLLGGLHSYA